MCGCSLEQREAKKNPKPPADVCVSILLFVSSFCQVVAWDTGSEPDVLLVLPLCCHSVDSQV